MKWHEANRRRRCADCGDRVPDGKGAWMMRGAHERLVHIGRCPRPLVKGGQGHTDQQIVDSTLIGGIAFAGLALMVLLAWLLQTCG